MPITLPVSYTSVSRVQSAFPSISSNTALNSAMIADYIGGVEAEINAKISKRYALPLTVACPLLQQLSQRMSIYRIAVLRQLVHFPPAQQGKLPLAVQNDTDEETLQKIIDGEINLVDSSGNVISASTVAALIYSTNQNYVPTMDRGDITKQEQDPTIQTDLDAARYWQS